LKGYFVNTSIVRAAVIFSFLFELGCGTTPSGTIGGATAAGVGTGLNGLGHGPSPVVMGTSANYVLLAESAITDIPTSAVTGNVGLSPGTGAGIGITCSEVTGVIQSADAAGPLPCRVTAPSTLTTAIGDMGTAYTDAAGRAPDYTEFGAGNIGGRNLGPATYFWSSALLIPSTVYLTGGPNDVWIFQVAQGLTVASGVQIVLLGGALPKNIYWQVFAAANLNTTSVFKGNIISSTSVVMKTGASITGRLLAGTGITLDQNVVTAP
jgi:hypothetical protein